MTFRANVVADDDSALYDLTGERPAKMRRNGRILVETQASTASPMPVALTGDVVSAEYERVAASQTDSALGATGATGDYLSHLVIVPATAAAGAVTIKDGGGSSMSVFAGGGTTALPTLAPIIVPFGARSLAGAWSVTTGANVSVFAVGNFT